MCGHQIFRIPIIYIFSEAKQMLQETMRRMHNFLFHKKLTNILCATCNLKQEVYNVCKRQEEIAVRPASFLHKGGIHLNQADLIQKIIAAEHQAQALAEHAKVQQENMEASIESEIEELRKQYQEKADAYLKQLQETQREKSAQYLETLDQRLQKKLDQVESIYQSRKDQWVEAIFDRIVGKAVD